MALDPHILRSSFELVVERAPNLTVRFYEIFFERYPQVRPMFGGKSSERQQRMLQDALMAVVDHLEDAPWLGQTLRALGAKHVGYGVRDEMYGWVGEALLATLAEVAAEAWTPIVAAQWTEAYGVIVSLMLEGAETARESVPTARAPRSAA